MPLCKACQSAGNLSEMCFACAKKMRRIAREIELIKDLYPPDEQEAQIAKVAREIENAGGR